MKTRVIALALSLLLALPIVVGAAGAPGDRKELPAAVDQILARDIIRMAQEELWVAGFYPGHVDGIFDDETEAALLAYQERYALPRTGLLDETTRGLLLPGFDASGSDD